MHSIDAGKPPHRPVRIAAFLLAMVAGWGWFYFFDPATVDAFLPCPFHAATGLDCPGCGSQRAVHHILHGNFSTAWRANPFIIVILPLLTLAIVQWYARDVLGYAMKVVRFPSAVTVGLVVLVIAYWIIRNL
jgi:hypothetical protein